LSDSRYHPHHCDHNDSSNTST